TSGDRKLISLQDSGTCAPAATSGHRYRISAWYKATTSVRFKAYYRDSSGVWDYWTQGPLLPAVSSYTRAEWTTPGAPSAARRLAALEDPPQHRRNRHSRLPPAEGERGRVHAVRRGQQRRHRLAHPGEGDARRAVQQRVRRQPEVAVAHGVLHQPVSHPRHVP